MPAEDFEVRLIPRLDRVDLAVPALGESAVKVVRVAKIVGKVRWLFRGPRWRDVINLQDL